MNITRAIQPFVRKDLGSKIVMIGGPRQVGKTTLGKSFLRQPAQYYTWDDLADRKKIRQHEIDPTLKIILLDEVHKYARWRTLLKGLYDKYHDQLQLIVTGSARLDHFRKGGDSLFGRYFYYRLHPLTVKEVQANFERIDPVEALLRFGGFPEPFVRRDETFLRRWQRERTSRVVTQDLADLETVKEISLLEVLADLLPARVGSPLSIRSLQEDLAVSPNTVSRWISLLEKVYYCYLIYPFGPAKVRAIKKTPKLYLWDWTEVPEPGPRWENFVASHLLKYCHFREDTEGVKMELRYLRDVDGRELDFVVLEDRKPLLAVECKTGERRFSPHLFYFRERTNIPEFFQVHRGERQDVDAKMRLLPFKEFCKLKDLP